MLDALELDALRHARLCELNVIEQVLNVCQTTIVEDAWTRGQPLSVHGWIYSLFDGRITDLGMTVEARGQLSGVYQTALGRLAGRD